ncbi:hypothetical protein CDD83_6281 [Cordyceps sp. RAO-2017]|nr:hypothetical protein CDD83_6281 [Cordyceps sp. RAO-2017]
MGLIHSNRNQRLYIAPSSPFPTFSLDRAPATGGRRGPSERPARRTRNEVHLLYCHGKRTPPVITSQRLFPRSETSNRRCREDRRYSSRISSTKAESLLSPPAVAPGQLMGWEEPGDSRDTDRNQAGPGRAQRAAGRDEEDGKTVRSRSPLRSIDVSATCDFEADIWGWNKAMVAAMFDGPKERAVSQHTRSITEPWLATAAAPADIEGFICSSPPECGSR